VDDRLSSETFISRLDLVYAARTRSELDQLVADVPEPSAARKLLLNALAWGSGMSADLSRAGRVPRLPRMILPQRPEVMIGRSPLADFVVANQTVDTDQLFATLKEKAADGPRRFVVIMPQGEGGGGDPYARLAQVLSHLEEAGLDAVGQVVHPDPFTAIQNAVRYYPVDDIVISTFEPERSGWMRSDLIERVKNATHKPVEHVVADGAPSKSVQDGQAA